MARDTGLTSPRFNKNRTTLDKYCCSFFSSPIEFFLEVKTLNQFSKRRPRHVRNSIRSTRTSQYYFNRIRFKLLSCKTPFSSRVTGSISLHTAELLRMRPRVLGNFSLNWKKFFSETMTTTFQIAAEKSNTRYFTITCIFTNALNV